MITQAFAPVLTVNRVYNAFIRRSIGDEHHSGIFTIGRLVRAQPVKTLGGGLKWSIDVPPYAASRLVDGDCLVPITTAENDGMILREDGYEEK